MSRNIREELLKAVGAETEVIVLVKTPEEAAELQQRGIQCTLYTESQYGAPPAYAYYRQRMSYNDYEINDLVNLKLLSTLSTIKKCLIFFVVLTLISLASTFVFWLILYNNVFMIF